MTNRWARSAARSPTPRTQLSSLITNLELLAEQPDDPSAPALVAAALAEAAGLRVLINDLVDNALKWSPPDGVTFRFSLPEVDQPGTEEDATSGQADTVSHN